jgi:trafficking protein particle complex subunit 3
MSKSSPAGSGQVLWSKAPKANAELFALTYGALVTEVIRDHEEDMTQINEALEKIGYSIGIRCVDEFLAKSNAPYCKTLAETAEVLGKTAFRMFLGIAVDVQMHNKTSFSLLFQENPLALFVELPDQYAQTLEYSILYCGVIRGALEMLNYKVECAFLKSPLKGDDIHEIKVDLKQVLADGAGDDYKEE